MIKKVPTLLEIRGNHVTFFLGFTSIDTINLSVPCENDQGLVAGSKNINFEKTWHSKSHLYLLPFKHPANCIMFIK